MVFLKPRERGFRVSEDWLFGRVQSHAVRIALFVRMIVRVILKPAHAAHTSIKLNKELTMLSDSKLQTIVLTSRPDEAEAFYREALGLTLKDRSDGALVFDVNGADLRVSPVPTTAPTEHTVLGFAVEDVDQTIAELAGRGIEFERFEHFTHEPNGALTTPDGARVAWFRDPDGNLMSVVQFA